MQPATDQQAEWFSHWFNALLDNVEQVIKGKRDQIALALVCLFSEGHLLVDDVPGTGKTSLAKAIAHSVKGTWSRIQFTPDLLPSDVTGGLVYNQSQGTFDFRRGAVFANVVLADEINRASPKTQAALLEVMEERHVTVDGVGYDVPRPFVVLATQNPVEQEGTYRLPEAQLDRFLMRTTLGYPDHDHEVDVLRMLADGLRPEGPLAGDVDVRRAQHDRGRRARPRRGLDPQLRRPPVRRHPHPARAAAGRLDTRRDRDDPHVPGARRRPGPPVRHRRRRAHRRPRRDGPSHAAHPRGRARQGRPRRARRAGHRPRRPPRRDASELMPEPFRVSPIRVTGDGDTNRNRRADVKLLRRLPLTASGWTVLALGVAAYVAGWQLGWVELMVVAAGCLIVLLAAIPFVVGRLTLDVERILDPERVTVGDRAIAVMRVTNPRRTPVASRTIEEHVGGRPLRLDIPPLGAGRATEAVYPLPTARRGIVTVGPALIVKSDLVNLMRREIVQTGTQTLWVHPRVVALRPLPVGYAKDLEGPTSDASPAGDVAFHALREYELGDDHRHIHWMSTARTGTLMVRHYVDNRRPNVTAVVDTNVESYIDPAGFDTAIEIAASLGVSSLMAEQPVAVWLDREALMGQNRPAARNDLLDRLTLAEEAAGTDIADAALHALRGEAGTSALVVITGNVPTDRFLTMSTVARRSVPGDPRPGVAEG